MDVHNLLAGYAHYPPLQPFPHPKPRISSPAPSSMARVSLMTFFNLKNDVNKQISAIPFNTWIKGLSLSYSVLLQTCGLRDAHATRANLALLVLH